MTAPLTAESGFRPDATSSVVLDGPGSLWQAAAIRTVKIPMTESRAVLALVFMCPSRGDALMVKDITVVSRKRRRLQVQPCKRFSCAGCQR